MTKLSSFFLAVYNQVLACRGFKLHVTLGTGASSGQTDREYLMSLTENQLGFFLLMKDSFK